MAAIQLLALLAVAGGAEEVHGQSSKRVQGGQVNIGVVKGQLRLDMVGERRGNSSSELIGRQGRASRGRPSRQSCTAKTGMSFTRYCAPVLHLANRTSTCICICSSFHVSHNWLCAPSIPFSQKPAHWHTVCPIIH